jgi:hypothetical protein
MCEALDFMPSTEKQKWKHYTRKQKSLMNVMNLRINCTINEISLAQPKCFLPARLPPGDSVSKGEDFT